jgi:hypothetical protein
MSSKKKTKKTAARKPASRAARKPAAKAPAKPAKRPAAKRAAKKAAPARARRGRAAIAKTPRAARGGPADVVAEVLRAVGWEADRSDDDDGWTSFVTHVDDGVVTIATVARVLEASSRFVMYAILAPRAAEAVRAEVADFLLRANYGLPDGNFEMDPSTGDVRFKIGVDFCGLSLPALMVRNAILDAGTAIENYGPAIARLLRGEIGAAEAIAMAEGAVRPAPES